MLIQRLITRASMIRPCGLVCGRVTTPTSVQNAFLEALVKG